MPARQSLEVTLAIAYLQRTGCAPREAAEQYGVSPVSVRRAMARLGFAQQPGEAWRLPLLEELNSLHTPNAHYSYNAEVFYGDDATAFFWTGTKTAIKLDYAWLVSFVCGTFEEQMVRCAFKAYVHLVRGGVEVDPAWGWLTKDGRWRDCGSGLAFDASTGLQWQRYRVGQHWDEGKLEGQALAMNWQQGMSRFDDPLRSGPSHI